MKESRLAPPRPSPLARDLERGRFRELPTVLLLPSSCVSANLEGRWNFVSPRRLMFRPPHSGLRRVHMPTESALRVGDVTGKGPVPRSAWSLGRGLTTQAWFQVGLLEAVAKGPRRE